MNKLRSNLDAVHQRLQETADHMDVFREDLQGRLRQRRWLRPLQKRLGQFKPHRPPIFSTVIRRLRRPAPSAETYARWIERLDDILEDKGITP